MAYMFLRQMMMMDFVTGGNLMVKRALVGGYQRAISANPPMLQVVIWLACVNLLVMLGVNFQPAHAEARANAPIRIIALGDSLVAGFGLAATDSLPVKLEKLLRGRGHNVEIVNAGVSGDTTAAGLKRLDWAVGDNADAVIVELGANDALRGLDPGLAKKNLEEILRRLKARGLPVLIAGMRAPLNLGAAYGEKFDAIFPQLAKAWDADLYPFILEGVAFRPELNQADGIHPNAKGAAIIARSMLPAVEQLIAKVKEKRMASHGK